MSRVLITGANGFIGSHLVDKFVKKGHEVFGFVRTTSDLHLLEKMDVSLRYGDITDYDSISKAMGGIDIVINNAGHASDWGSLESFRKVNLEGTKNVARAAADKKVKRFIHMSTTAIHGFSQTHAASEEDPKNPVFNYGISKLEAENWLTDYSSMSDMEVTTIRPGNVFGPGDYNFIEKYIEAMKTGKIAYVSKGLSLTCPTYVRNLTEGVYLASHHENAPGETFIITDGLHINWRQFTEAIADQMSLTYPRLSIPLGISLCLASLAEGIYKLAGSNHPPLITKYRMFNAGTGYFFSIDKARKLLGYNPLFDIQTAIKETVLWFQKGHS